MKMPRRRSSGLGTRSFGIAGGEVPASAGTTRDGRDELIAAAGHRDDVAALPIARRNAAMAWLRLLSSTTARGQRVSINVRRSTRSPACSTR